MNFLYSLLNIFYIIVKFSITGTKEAQVIIAAIEKLQKNFGKNKRLIESGVEINSEMLNTVRSFSVMRLREVFR